MIVLVGHQVNILALTDEATASGEGLVLAPDRASGFRVVGRLAP